MLVALAVWKFSNSQDAVRSLFDEYIEWTRGEGQDITGPIAALLLLLTGRPEAAREWAERTGEPWTGVAAPR